MDDNDEKPWSIEQVIANFKACNRPVRGEDEMWSADITRPTTEGGTADLASAIKPHGVYEPKEED